MSKKENYASDHRHRAIIGFDENGIPRVLKPVEGHTHTHTDEDGHEYEHSHEEAFTEDYIKAVSASHGTARYRYNI